MSDLLGMFVCHNPLMVLAYQPYQKTEFREQNNRNLSSATCFLSPRTIKVWAIPGSLATTAGIVVYFLFLALLRCFSSRGYRLKAYKFS